MAHVHFAKKKKERKNSYNKTKDNHNLAEPSAIASSLE